MNPVDNPQGVSIISPHVVENAHDVTRWVWLRDACTTDQLEVLKKAIQYAETSEDRQKAIEQVADKFVADLLLEGTQPNKRSPVLGSKQVSTCR